MPSIQFHHGALWAQVKGLKAPGKWGRIRTPFSEGQEDSAQRYADKIQAMLDKRTSDQAAGVPTGDDSVDAYALWWLAEREKRGVASVVDDRGRYMHHIRPHLGHLILRDVTPMHIRDMVRAHKGLVKSKAMAPRTARHCYAVARSMFRDAATEQRIMTNPAGKDQLGKGELPPVLDADGEWRSEATYELWEVERLISDDRIPPDRLVQNALKALAGLRHGELAVARWRNYKPEKSPLGRLVIVTPKTGVTREIPVHPLLAKILATWKLSLWERTYGRAPTADDLIAPTRAMTAPDGRQSCAAFQRDLVTLGLRQKAGQARNRGGHDLRSWFISTCQENGAHRDILATITHTKRGDVIDGYTRLSWAAKCAEVAKLKISLPDDRILPLSTRSSTSGESARIRWAFKARRTDRRSIQERALAAQNAPTAEDQAIGAGHSGPERAALVIRLSTELAAATLAGDEVNARRLALEIRALTEPGAAGRSAVAG